MSGLALVLLPALCLGSAEPFADSPAAPGDVRSGKLVAIDREIVISFRPKPTRPAPRWLRSSECRLPSALAGARLLRDNRLGVVDLALSPGVDVDRFLAALSRECEIDFVEIATPVVWHGVPNDPGFAAQWHLHNTGQGGGKIGADLGAAWAYEIEDGDPAVVIAMVDAGVDLDHPDLAPNLLRNPFEIPGNGRDDDRNGFVDDFIEIDLTPESDLVPGDRDHGTAVAGVIAAAGNNRLGVAGLAGGGRDGAGCALLPLRIGPRDTDGSAIDDAILHAIDRGARVICLPLGIAPSRAIDLAIDEARVANVVVVASAGNGGPISYPASHPWVIAVSGSTRSDRSAGFSAGARLSVVAPSVEVLSTLPGGSYGLRSGTSFAAPQVAALAGLIRSLVPGLAASQVRSIIEDSATDLETVGFDERTGFGRIDAFRALRLARTAMPPRIETYGRAVHSPRAKPPVITTNGAPPISGDEEFSIVLADAPPRRSAWLLIGADLTSNSEGDAAIDPISVTLALPTTTDARGEAKIAGLLGSGGSLSGRRFFAQWLVADPTLPHAAARSRILAVSIGN